MDTSADAQARIVAALRKMSPAQRLAAAAALSDDIRALAEAGIRSRHPEFAPEEVGAAMAEILLGLDLARKAPGRASVAAK
jgi:hypothetical protein